MSKDELYTLIALANAISENDNEINDIGNLRYILELEVNEVDEVDTAFKTIKEEHLRDLSVYNSIGFIVNWMLQYTKEN